MSIPVQVRVSRGQPAGGQFTSRFRSDAAVSLAETPVTVEALDELRRTRDEASRALRAPAVAAMTAYRARQENPGSPEAQVGFETAHAAREPFRTAYAEACRDYIAALDAADATVRESHRAAHRRSA